MIQVRQADMGRVTAQRGGGGKTAHPGSRLFFEHRISDPRVERRGKATFPRAADITLPQHRAVRLEYRIVKLQEWIAEGECGALQAHRVVVPHHKPGIYESPDNRARFDAGRPSVFAMLDSATAPLAITFRML